MGAKLYVNGRFLTQPLSGVQRFATEITATLRRLYPDRVVVLAPDTPQTRALDVRIVGRRHGQMWEQFDLARYAQDGVLVNLGNIAPLCCRAQMVVIHDAGVFATPEAYSWRFRSWYKFAQRRLVQSGAQIVTVSQFARGELVRNLAVPPDRIAVISEGADHMARIVADRSVLSRVPAPRFVLAVGNLAAHKNLSALGLLSVRLAVRGVALVITGGAAAGVLRGLSARALPQPACYIGRVTDNELKALYEAALCLVFPSRYEGFGLPTIEAMACGCPVVASRIPALLEVCGDAARGFDPDSADDIAEQVCDLITDDAARADLRDAGYRQASRFTWAAAAGELMDSANAR